MIIEGNICHITQGCRAMTSLSLAPKCPWLGAVSVTLINIKLHNLKLPLAI